MLQKVRQEMKEKHMLCRKDRVVLGVSGGADSVFLFYAFVRFMKEFDASFVVVHVNHGIRGEEAQQDALFVERLCEEYEVPFYLFCEDVPAIAKERGMSEEEAGRVVRYEHFYEVAQKEGANKVATAHHQGDQVETILFHLIRGTKLAGMQGMAAISKVPGRELELIRPLLPFAKEELVTWLEEQGYSWQEDATNQHNQYARNKLRNEVIPTLTQINHQAVNHILEFAQNATIWQEYLDQQVAKYWTEQIEVGRIAKGATVEYVLNRMQLREEAQVFIKEVLYQVIITLAGRKQDITKEHVEAVFHLLFAQSGKQVNLPYEMMAEVSYEKLRIRKCLEINAENAENADGTFREEYRIPLDAEVQIPYKTGILRAYVVDLEQLQSEVKKSFLVEMTKSKNIYTKVFDCDTIKNTPCVRNPKQEDYFVMNEDGNRKKLSRFFIDCKIPKEERGSMDVVADGNEILWIVGYRRCSNHLITEQTKRVLVLKWIHEGERNE